MPAPPPAAAPTPDGFSALSAGLAALNPDEMSPREAMEALYRLKETLAKAQKN